MSTSVSSPTLSRMLLGTMVRHRNVASKMANHRGSKELRLTLLIKGMGIRQNLLDATCRRCKESVLPKHVFPCLIPDTDTSYQVGRHDEGKNEGNR